MAKTVTHYLCSACGSSFPKWLGKCSDCGAWDTLESFRVDKSARSDGDHAPPGMEEPIGSGAVATANAPALPIEEIDDQTGAGPRWSTGLAELDRVLGGGLVRGSAVLVGGDPGIGKSTLLLQAAGRIAQGGASVAKPKDDTGDADVSEPQPGRRVLYVTSEESAGQLKMRAERLFAEAASSADPGATAAIDPEGRLHVLADTNLARVLEQARRVKPDVIVIDSIQMVYRADLPAAAGSVTQLRRCSLDMIRFAKSGGAALLMVGHVTKQGQLAGPKLLEHMVDTVLYFEGDRYHAHRVVRSIKNRFGATLEVGLFEMTGSGLRESGAGRGVPAAEASPRPGSVIAPVYQGSRCLLVEIQALTATGVLGNARRKVSGIDSSRLSLLIAVLEKRGGVRLADQDVFASSVGGMKIIEPAADLALCLAIAGAHLERTLEPATAVFGEVGLGGEVRSVNQIEPRLVEAARLGFKRVLGPELPAATLKTAKRHGVSYTSLRDIGMALECLT